MDLLLRCQKVRSSLAIRWFYLREVRNSQQESIRVIIFWRRWRTRGWGRWGFPSDGKRLYRILDKPSELLSDAKRVVHIIPRRIKGPGHFDSQCSKSALTILSTIDSCQPSGRETFARTKVDIAALAVTKNATPVSHSFSFYLSILFHLSTIFVSVLSIRETSPLDLIPPSTCRFWDSLSAN